jgi:hypothetical protein
MRFPRYTTAAVFFLILCQFSIPCFAQLGISFDIKKPKEYEDRVLRSEKTDEKKFTLPTRFIQNTVTHYNYFFNANNKLNEVLERAKTAFSEDYSKLLPFYNYSLDVTARDSVQLDSISYKSQSAIALHDLRNDWIDNMYLLWGASYYLRKQFDSAFLMFQFINYAFAEKEKDGYYKSIGSSKDGNNAFSISTTEKTNLPKKLLSEPPSRNDAFIWQIRNFLARDEFAEAASLIVILKGDPAFPKRLQNDLHEVQSYWFYKQNIWDSAAAHLVLALDNATNKQEKARWEYLAAQLYELSGNYKEAERYYGKVISHTTDLIMEIYARLYMIRVNKDGGEKDITKNIAELVRMGKRDKYQDYRDIIYFMAAQMELERNNIGGAISMLEKSTQLTGNSVTQRNKAFLQLAELSFAQKEYRKAYNYYDSLKLDDTALKNTEAILSRKEILGALAMNIEIIERQDSLQRIARMTEEERKDFVKRLVRQLRKQQGLKDEPGMTTGAQNNQPPSNLFSSNEVKGEWYFYNTSSRTRGQNDFKARWGNRPNTDNWRRSAVISPGLQITNKQNPPTTGKQPINNTPGSDEISYDALYERLPLTPELLQASNDSLQEALFALGKLYIHEIEDCPLGTITYEDLRTRFPNYNKMDEVLFNLYYCYNKNGETAKAATIKKLMTEKYASSNFTTIVTTGKNPQSTTNPDATFAYEQIYDLFIEGNFEQAIAQKAIADSMYGRNYWTPQLLYIESVYYIKQRQDSTAIGILTNITTQFSQSPLAPRATALINILRRRNVIEEELRNLVINRPGEDTVAKQPVVVINQPPRPKQDSIVVNKPQPPVTKNTPDTIINKSTPKFVNSPFTYSPEAAHYVMVVLNKIDPVFINEARNAFSRYNRETFYNKQMDAQLMELDAENKLLLISPFKNAQEAIDYVDRTRPKASTEIIPWLRGGKYSFSIITEKNLSLLLTNKDIGNYKSFLNQSLPGKFID